MAVFGVFVYKGNSINLAKRFNKNFKNPKAPYHLVEGRAKIIKDHIIISFRNYASIIDLPSIIVYFVLSFKWRKEGYKTKYVNGRKLINLMEAGLYGTK